ncbi:MAG: hypothetical protein QS721_11945 [Candidatus Endonucleobacter sp. (ex Gigantidas childressi)]|nr:hypothetical protein [Candidatus Endonucleobacter sp. (ex Gigantidas childressi)]
MSEGRINIIDAIPIETERSGSGHDKSGKPTKYPEAGYHVKNDSRGNKKTPMVFPFMPVSMKMALFIGKA